jgi:protein ImuB
VRWTARRTPRADLSAKPDEIPLALVEKDRGTMRIAALDHAAVQSGLTIGMGLADARARLPVLDAVQMDRPADQARLHDFAAMMELFTPLVALDGRDGLILDITGCAHLFGGEGGLHEKVRQRLARLGFTSRATVAGTPEAAHALARFAKVDIVAPGGEEAAVRSLPVTALEADGETTVALVRAGLKMLGELADRPLQMLTARFGEALTARFIRILGREDIRITPLRAPPDCIAEQHFPEPLLETDTLDQVLAKLAEDVCAVLERRGMGGRQFEASLFRTDGAVRRLIVETSAPCRDERAVRRLFKMRMETLADPVDVGFGFDAVRLAVSVVEIVAERQSSLDGRAVEDGALGDLIDRLIVRFGRERVLRFVGEDSHDPVRAGGTAQVARSSAPSLRPNVEPGEPPSRPLQLFSAPQPIEALAEVPDGPPLRFRWRRVLHEIASAEGPERIAPEWWLEGNEAPQTRDYYRIEDAEGRRFWVFRQGLYGQAGRPRWFIHGLFA